MLDEKNILGILEKIFREKLCDESLVLNYETTANDILEWNSLKHLILIIAIEKQFKIKFSPLDLASMQNIGEMIKTIKKLS